MNLSEKIGVIESIVKIPSYLLVGIAKDRVVLLSDLSGEMNLWAYNLLSGDMYMLSSGGVVDAKTCFISPHVIYSQDMSKGRELSILYIINVSDPDSSFPLDMNPMRIMGIGFDGTHISFVGVEDTSISLFLSDLEGNVEKLFSGEKFIELTSIDSHLVSGYGVLRDNSRSMELFIYDLNDNEFKVYTPLEDSINEYPEVKSGKILFSSNWAGAKSLFVYNYNTNSIDKVVSSQLINEYEINDFTSFGWIDENNIWFLGKSNGETKLFVGTKHIPTPRGYAEYAAFYGDHIYLSSSSLSNPPKIYDINIESGRYNVLIDNPMPEKVSKAFSKVEFIRYKSFDCIDIPAYYIESSYESKPGISIIYVHGGPWWEVPNKWNYSIASFVSLGYHVIAPNYRGSTGYGEDFRVMDIGDPGGGDLKDIVYSERWFSKNGFSSKKAIFGYSYGGYMTYLALTKYPDEWDAGVAGAGIVDWEESYKLSDKLFQSFIQILFDDNNKLFPDRSPIYFAEKLGSPLCIIHPQNDSRTPLKPILRFIGKLLELNKSFEAHILPDVGHVFKTKEDLFKLIYPAIIFLDRVLK